MGILDIEAQRLLQQESGHLPEMDLEGTNSRAIPQALLDLLSHAWQRTGGFSEFEQSFEARRVPWERYEHVAGETNLGSAFTSEEIDGLAESGVLNGLAHSRDGGVQVITHAEHAVADFCAEVYEAWDRLTARLEMIRAEDAEALRARMQTVALLD